MDRQHETGHAARSAAFDELIAYVQNMGPTYNPPTSDLTVEALQQKATTASQIQKQLATNNALYKMAKTNRNEAFKPINSTVRQVLDLTQALGINHGTVEQMKSITSSILGTKRLSQQGMDARLDNLNQMIELLKNVDGYITNRDHLKIEGLETLASNIKIAADDVVRKETVLIETRRNRQKAFGKDEGLTAITRRVKAYLKSLMGARSNDYKQVVRITKVLT
ncbi:hypothetical protein DMA11_22525 [Marinilabiliaceae bacterium JC017]|nr:hypothetical protein DMA11_22525 [Marinilabiliaceae bacterium JC017]